MLQAAWWVVALDVPRRQFFVLLYSQHSGVQGGPQLGMLPTSMYNRHRMATDPQDCQRQCSMATGHCTGEHPLVVLHLSFVLRGRSSVMFTLYWLKPTSGFEFHFSGRCELWSKPAWCSVQQKQSVGNCGCFGSLIFEYQDIRSLADFLYLKRSQVGASAVLSGYYCGALATVLASATMSRDKAPSLDMTHVSLLEVIMQDCNTSDFRQRLCCKLHRLDHSLCV